MPTMNIVQKFLSGKNSMKHEVSNRVRRHWLVVSIVVIITGLMLVFTLQAQSHGPYKFNLVPSSDAIKDCLPHVSATVMVFPKEELRGVDTLDLKAEGLPPNTAFTVFLTETPNFLFGA